MMYFKVSPIRRRRGARRGRRGFSIVEALVAAAVLGIALIGLVKLHTATMRGMKSSKDITNAAEIAAQAAEYAATIPWSDLPTGCAAVAEPGCKQGVTTLAQAYTAPKASACNDPLTCECTLWTAAGQMRDGLGDITGASASDEATAAPGGYIYRVDQVVSPHPTFPETMMVTVSTCWRDELGYVREVQTTRIVPNGI